MAANNEYAWKNLSSNNTSIKFGLFKGQMIYIQENF